jgi:hypothetical protein
MKTATQLYLIALQQSLVAERGMFSTLLAMKRPIERQAIMDFWHYVYAFHTWRLNMDAAMGWKHPAIRRIDSQLHSSTLERRPDEEEKEE